MNTVRPPHAAEGRLPSVSRHSGLGEGVWVSEDAHYCSVSECHVGRAREVRRGRIQRLRHQAGRLYRPQSRHGQVLLTWHRVFPVASTPRLYLYSIKSRRLWCCDLSRRRQPRRVFACPFLGGVVFAEDLILDFGCKGMSSPTAQDAHICSFMGCLYFSFLLFFFVVVFSWLGHYCGFYLQKDFCAAWPLRRGLRDVDSVFGR